MSHDSVDMLYQRRAYDVALNDSESALNCLPYLNQVSVLCPKQKSCVTLNG